MIGPGMVAENSIVCRSSGTIAQDALDVGQEAQVEHLVGLVQHQRADLAEHQVALFGQVEQAAGRADDDVDALAQRRDLRLVGAAAVDRGDRTPRCLPASVRSCVTWRHSSRVGTTTSACGVPSPGRSTRCSSGTPKPEGLAGAGAGLADEVVAGESERERQLLDGEGALDAGFAERLHDLVDARRARRTWGSRTRTGASASSGCDVSSSGTPASLCSSATGSRCAVYFSGQGDQPLSYQRARALAGPLDRAR